MSGSDHLRLDFSSSRSAGGAGAPTLTTPTLTPTTLRNIEQMFLDHESSTSILDGPPSPPFVHENAAHFVPPFVALSKSDMDDVPTTAGDNAEDPAASPALPNCVPLTESINQDGESRNPVKTEYSEHLPFLLPIDNSKSIIAQLPSSHLLPTKPTSLALLPSALAKTDSNGTSTALMMPDVALRLYSDYPSTVTVAAVATATMANSAEPVAAPVISPRRSTSRSRRSLSGEPTDDERRRLLRRQRNKEAAARCRKRRLDQTVSLQDEVDQWEERNNKFRREIEELEEQQRQLLALLENHRAAECKMEKKL